MRYYGWETDKDYRHSKELDCFRHRPTHKWFTRYQHKAARKKWKNDVYRERYGNTLSALYLPDNGY